MKCIYYCLLMSIGWKLIAQPVSHFPIELNQISFHENQPADRVWIENGIPIAPGLVRSPRELELTHDGSPVPADFQTLAWWPDGSIRWCLLITAWRTGGTFALQLRAPTEKEVDQRFKILIDEHNAIIQTGVIQVRLNANRSGVFHEVTMSSQSNGVYDVPVLHAQDDLQQVVSGKFDLVHDGTFSKRLHYTQDYSNGTIGAEWWLTVYRDSGHLSLEYTVRNGKSPLPTSLEAEGHLSWRLDSNFSQSGMFYDGESISESMQLSSDGTRLNMLGTVSMGSSNGTFSALVKRFGTMYPRRIERTDMGDVTLHLFDGELRPFTAHGIELKMEITPQGMTSELLQNWGEFYEFTPMLLPPLDWIQGTGAWDGGFLGDVRSLRDRTDINSELREHWSDQYTFTPRTPGWRQYGETTIPIEGNAHGPGAQMSGAFDRFVVLGQKDRFLQAEEMAIALMESRGIALDGIELSPDSGYETYNTWFDYPIDRSADQYPANTWSDPVEGRMWDAGHRGFYPLTEYYYLTGSQRAAKAFHQLTLGSRYINLREPSLALGSRTAAYFWTQYARHYSIFRDPVDLQMIQDNWNRTRKPQAVVGNDAFQSMHPSGILVSFAPYEDDTGFPPGGMLTKLIFQNVLMQSYYDLYQLTGLEQARDLLYTSGQWQMRIYRQLGYYEPPNYAYRPWLEESPSGSNASGETYFWGAQNFPGMALYYHMFGDFQARQILDRANQVYWTGQTAGFASAIAFATNQTKPDHQPPAAISELFFDIIEDNTVRLTWRNVDDAKTLQIKYTHLQGPIKDLHSYDNLNGVAWWKMEPVEGEPVPGEPGNLQNMDLTLQGDPLTFRFAIKTQDEWGNISPLSREGRMNGSEPAPALSSPNDPPVAITVPQTTIALENGQTMTSVTLDASASFDPEGESLVFDWTGDPDPEDLEMTSLQLGQGEYDFELRVRDPSGQWSLPVAANVVVQGEGMVDPVDPPDPIDEEPDILPDAPILTGTDMVIQAGPGRDAPWRDALITELQDANANLGGVEMASLYAEDGGGQHRLLLWFPLPSLNDGLELEKATLHLTQGIVEGTPPLPMTVRIHPLLESWTEGRGQDPWMAGSGVSWNERKSGLPWSLSGGTFDLNHSVLAELPTEQDQTIHVDITSLAERWYASDLTNHGLILIPDDGYWVTHGIHTRESSMGENRPGVQLVYRQSSTLLDDYDHWLNDWNHYFVTLSKEMSLPDADPDNDQQPNWLEFALNGDPGIMDSLTGMHISLNEGTLVLDIPTIRESPLVTWSVDWSQNLIHWENASSFLDNAGPTTAGDLIWSGPLDAEKTFFRLRMRFEEP